MNGGGGGGGGSGQFPNADPSQAADPSVGMTAVDHAAYEESVVRVKDQPSFDCHRSTPEDPRR